MENQEEKETSIEYFYDKVLDASEFYESEYKAIVDALDEAKKMYAEEIDKAKKEAFTMGYHSAIKYNYQIESLK
jgi:hypothetical protein